MDEMDPGWHTADFPELRHAPPWVMEEMILAQPSLVESILGADGPDLAALRDTVLASARAGAPVVVTGCGTSEHGALAVAELLSDAFRRKGISSRAEARQALDAALDPRAGGVCIAISHEGATRATQLALDAARANGASTVIVTACGDAACVASADRAFVTPTHDDSWCHTLAYTSAILAGANIAGRALDAEGMVSARRAIETTIERRGDFAVAAAHLNRAGRIVTAGLGIDQIGSGELALKIAEGARVPTTAYHLETLLHGHLAGCDAETTSLVLLGLDPRLGARRDRRLALVAQAAQVIGITTVAIAPGKVLRDLPRSVHRVVLDPIDGPDGLLTALLQGTLAVQLLTLGLVQLVGVNPDLIRREEAAYREAAHAADAPPDW